LTVADDLLKNDGKKFIEMMEQLAERRMAREEDSSEQFSNPNYDHPPNGSMHPIHNGLLREEVWDQLEECGQRRQNRGGGAAGDFFTGLPGGISSSRIGLKLGHILYLMLPTRSPLAEFKIRSRSGCLIKRCRCRWCLVRNAMRPHHSIVVRMLELQLRS
jgi:hypothetical protein